MITETMLARARAGDADAFRALTEPHRHELHLHCYRIVGSLHDAEDLVQETLLAAWRGIDQFEGRSSLRAWLHRIATNRCLNALRSRRRWPQEVYAVAQLPEPTHRTEPTWLEPYPDVLLDQIVETEPGPEARYEATEAIALAFVAALQHLPPRQRAVLVLRDVLGFRTAETAEMLDSSPAAVKGALQRARATLETRHPTYDRERSQPPRSPGKRELADRFATAVESDDIDGVLALLTDDAWLTMPPQPYEYQGRIAIGAFLENRAQLHGGLALRLIPTRANRQLAFGCYLPDPNAAIAHCYGLMVLTLDGDQISAITWFGDTSVFPYFGLPRTIRE